MKVAVYGTLQIGQPNHDAYLKKAKYVGEFESLPIFNFYSVRNQFPAITRGGHTSVFMEVFEVTNEMLEEIDRLEGYSRSNPDISMYTRQEIDTPFGQAYVYIYNRPVKTLIPIKNTHHWKDYAGMNKSLNVIY